MIYELRPYQVAGVQDIRGAFRAGCRAVLYYLPTAGGKTIVFCHIAERAAAMGKRILILVHRKELLDQAIEKFLELKIPFGVIAPKRTQTNDLVQVASVDTLIRRLSRIEKPDLVIVDEAHHCIPGNKWGKVIDFHNPFVLGVTATPCRLKGKGLGKKVGGYFERLILGPPIKKLTGLGFLSPAKTFASLIDIDMSGVKTQAGDFEKSTLAQAVDTQKITGNVVEHYQKFVYQLLQAALLWF